MKRLCVFFAFLALALNAPLVFAITLAFSPVDQTVNLGDPVTVEVQVTELDPTSPIIVGAYDFNVLYDPLMFSFTGIDFGTHLGGPTDSDQSSVSNPGSLNAVEVSLLSAANLATLQDPLSEFTLFSLNFKAIGEGTSPLRFSGNIAPNNDFLSDEQGNVISLAQTGTGSITANPQAVPEPGTLSLMAAAFAMAWRRRRRGATSL